MWLLTGDPATQSEAATRASTDGTTAAVAFPAVGREQITAAFDGGRLSCDGSVVLLAQDERRLGIAEGLARFVPDQREPGRVKHAITDMSRAGMFAIACGYEHCNDFGALRAEPVFKLVYGHLPETRAGSGHGADPVAAGEWPSVHDGIRLSYALIDQWMDSYATAPDGEVLDIVDSCEVVQGHQQRSLFNASCDERRIRGIQAPSHVG